MKEINYLTDKERISGKAGYILAPYKTIVTKTIISDKDGRREYWQINKWQRLKLWFNSLFHKSIKFK